MTLGTTYDQMISVLVGWVSCLYVTYDVGLKREEKLIMFINGLLSVYFTSVMFIFTRISQVMKTQNNASVECPLWKWVSPNCPLLLPLHYFLRLYSLLKRLTSPYTLHFKQPKLMQSFCIIMRAYHRHYAQWRRCIMHAFYQTFAWHEIFRCG